MFVVIVISLSARPAPAQPSECGFGGGLFGLPGMDGPVSSFATFDDGTGLSLYAAGGFGAAGRAFTDRIARWTGDDWVPVGGGLRGPGNAVYALATFDDGRGPALYAAGAFTVAGGAAVSNVARWDGFAWEDVGGGTDGRIHVLAVHDDGRGPALYAGGIFRIAGGVPCRNIARWDGTAWSPLGAGTNGEVNALATFDEGAGPALFVGGGFRLAGGIPARYLARWDGTAWTAAGLSSPETPASGVISLAVFDDGRGPALYAGITLHVDGLDTARGIGRWDGSTWTAVGAGLSYKPRELIVFDDGSGPALFAFGRFTQAGGLPAAHAAKWDGVSWTPLGGGLVGGPSFEFFAALPYDDGSGSRLFVGGSISRAGDVRAANCVIWDGSAWSNAGPGLNSRVNAIAAYEGGAGHPRLVVGGVFDAVGGVASRHVVQWDSSGFSPLGEGLPDVVSSLLVVDDGTNRGLYAGSSTDLSPSSVHRWDGASWSALGIGPDGDVHSLVLFDDGTGPALVAGGSFSAPGDGVVRWDGASWRPLGPGLPPVVLDLAVLDDGSGETLFAIVPGSPVGTGLFRFDGAAFVPVGESIGGSLDAIAVHDGAIYVGGRFDAIDGVAATGVARWDGASFSPVGLGLGSGFDQIRVLAVGNAGAGPELFAGGRFQVAGGVPALNVARWNGTSWSALGSGVGSPSIPNQGVQAIAFARDNTFHRVFVGGAFDTAGGVVSHSLARYSDACGAAARGTVDAATGRVVDVLFVNDSNGGDDRRVEVVTYEPIVVFLAAPPAARTFAPFALYVHAQAPSPSTVRFVSGLGYTCLPTPLSGGSPQPRVIWNNTGSARLGSPARPAARAPAIVVSRATGTGRAGAFFLQGIVRDPRSAGRGPWSVTNGVLVTAR